MAKKTIVQIEVTDNGSLKILGKDARKAGKDVGSVAKNTAESDRRLKSLSNQTSNTTKAFSKQAQTISGGLVPIYATLAAQVFAVSAAFRFFQEASDFRNLIAGQQAFGAMTGVMYKSLAKDIREATNAQISYTDASQAAAIGIASGLNATQLSQLGKAAADVSLVLGRDVTDSFQRLVRGVTKAEPELLDELGIVLRLDPALRNYAAAIGKTKDELNAFERSQAVAGEVIGQAEEKFGKVQQILDPQAFAFNQFGQAFNDVLDGLKSVLGGFAQTVLPFFTNNIGALIGALGLFILPIAKSILPNFKALEKQSADTVSSLKDDISIIKKEQETLNVARGMAGTTDPSALKASAAAALKSDFGITGKLTAKRVAAFKRSAELQIGVAKNMNKKELAQFKQHLRNMEIAHKMSLNKQVSAQQAAELKKQSHIKRTELIHKQAMTAMTRVTGFAAKAMNRAFMAMGIAGIAVMLFDAVRGVIGMFKETDEEAEAAEKRMEALNEKSESANETLKRMTQLRRDGLISLGEAANSAANAISSIGVASFVTDLQLAAKSGPKLEKNLFFKGKTYKKGSIDPRGDQPEALKGGAAVFENLAAVTANEEARTAFLDYAKTLKDGGIADAETTANVINLANSVVQLNSTAQAYKQNIKTATQAQADFLQKFAPNTPAIKAVTAYDNVIDSIGAKQTQLQQEIDAENAKGANADQDAIKAAKEKMQLNKKEIASFELSKKQLEDLTEAERAHNFELQFQKTIKAAIRKDGSVQSAIAERQVKFAIKDSEIATTRATIEAQQKILEEEGADLSEERFKNAEESLYIAEERLETLKAEKAIMGDLVNIELARIRNEQKRRGDAISLSPFNRKIEEFARDPKNIAEVRNQFMTEEDAIQHLRNQAIAIERTNLALELEENVMNRLGTALTDGLGSALLAIVDGSKSAKEAFSALAKSVIADIAKMAIRAAVLSFLFPGRQAVATIGPPVPGGGRYGGIMSPSGKSFRYGGMAVGGIASGPESGYTATLHGTEAVVPLGNDRTIPVKFSATGTGATSNVTVNVNMETGETTTTAEEDGKRLGIAISAAVQKELEIQRRPGGALRM